MPSTAAEQCIDEAIAMRGRITVAEFMELALYHPAHGYYSSATRRSGRGGDFYTSVDAGPLFGACIARYLVQSHNHQIPQSPNPFDVVDAGAGTGRLSRDVLDALQQEAPGVYAAVRLHLVERSGAARAAQLETLGPHADKLVYSGDTLPACVRGVIIANELLDALPCHRVVMTGGRLREDYVSSTPTGRLRLESGELSDDRIGIQLERAGITLQDGWRAEVSVAAAQWVADASRALTAGTLMIFDYGHEARELYSAAHAEGTLARYVNHRVDRRWLDDAGASDLTAHVDFTTIRQSAEAEGLRLRQFTDQTRFLLDCGIADRLPSGGSVADVRQRLAARTLLAPEGLGGTIKVMVLERPERRA